MDAIFPTTSSVHATHHPNSPKLVLYQVIINVVIINIIHVVIGIVIRKHWVKM